MKQIKKTSLAVTSIVLFGLLITSTVYAYDGDLWLDPQMDESMGHKSGNHVFGPGMRLGAKNGFAGEIKDIGAEILGLTADQLKSKIDSGLTLQEIIKEAGYTQESFRQAMNEKMTADMKSKLEQLVNEGKITTEQMNKKLDHIQERERWAHDLRDKILSAQAELLDMSSAELQAKLDSGDNLKDLVKEAGFTIEEFHSKMSERRTAIEKEHLKDLLSQGKITQDEYDRMIKQIENGQLPGLPGERAGNRFESVKAPLQELVETGVITADQLDKILAKLEKFGSENKPDKFIGHGGQGIFNGSQALGLN
ncbi:MAG: hypothetical protein ACOZBH_01805 [Patescibacteria group bacterium]